MLRPGMNDEEQTMELRTRPAVKYWLKFSILSPQQQAEVVKNYEVYLILTKNSIPGRLYQKARKHLAESNVSALENIGNIANRLLEENDYESPEEFDPKYIANHHDVKLYREVNAKYLGEIPDEFKDAFL